MFEIKKKHGWRTIWREEEAKSIQFAWMKNCKQKVDSLKKVNWGKMEISRGHFSYWLKKNLGHSCEKWLCKKMLKVIVLFGRERENEERMRTCSWKRSIWAVSNVCYWPMISLFNKRKLYKSPLHKRWLEDWPSYFDRQSSLYYLNWKEPHVAIDTIQPI